MLKNHVLAPYRDRTKDEKKKIRGGGGGAYNEKARFT